MRCVTVTVWGSKTHDPSAAAVPDSVVMQVLEERLSRADCSCRGWILHGFPRDLPQAVTLQESQYQPNRYVWVREVTSCLTADLEATVVFQRGCVVVFKEVLEDWSTHEQSMFVSRQLVH